MKSLLKKKSANTPIVLFSAVGSSQPTVTIKLIVDTAKFDKKNWPASCHFKAIWSNSNTVKESTPGKLECFSIEANVGDIIIWEGESSSSQSAVVDITKIRRAQKSGTKIFKNRSNYGAIYHGSKKESVEAEVLSETIGKADYKYDISFKIKNAAGANGTYKIDPKMRIMRR